MDFSIFFILYVFDVKESVFRSFTRPLCSGDLKNPGQLPVLQELESTDGWVSWIFVIFSFPTFSKSRFDKTTMFGCPQKSRSTSGFRRYSRVLSIWVLWISVISSFLTFSMSRNLFFVVSHSCSVRMTSKIQVNFRFCRISRVLTIGSYGFL